MSIEEKFNCCVCGTSPIAGFYKGKPYCETHFNEATGHNPNESRELCCVNGCGNDAVINYKGEWWCRKHFWNLRKKETADKQKKLEEFK